MSLVDRARKYRTDPLTDPEVEEAMQVRQLRSHADLSTPEPGSLRDTCVMRPTCSRCGPCREWLGRDCSIELAGKEH